MPDKLHTKKFCFPFQENNNYQNYRLFSIPYKISFKNVIITNTHEKQNSVNFRKVYSEVTMIRFSSPTTLRKTLFQKYFIRQCHDLVPADVSPTDPCYWGGNKGQRLGMSKILSRPTSPRYTDIIRETILYARVWLLLLIEGVKSVSITSTNEARKKGVFREVNFQLRHISNEMIFVIHLFDMHVVRQRPLHLNSRL